MLQEDDHLIAELVAHGIEHVDHHIVLAATTSDDVAVSELPQSFALEAQNRHSEHQID